MVLLRPGRWRWWDWCTLQPHDVVTRLDAPPSPSLSSMWGSSFHVMGLSYLIIIGRLLLLTLVVLSNPEQPTTLFMLCVHPDRLSWKRPKHQPLHIKQYLCSLKILRMCFLAVWISQKPLPEYISSIWSTSLLVSHFLWTSSDPTSLEMSRSIQQKMSWKQCAKVVLLNPHTTPSPPMQWLLFDGFVDS